MQQSSLIGRMAPQTGWFVQWQTLNGSLPFTFTAVFRNFVRTTRVTYVPNPAGGVSIGGDYFSSQPYPLRP